MQVFEYVVGLDVLCGGSMWVHFNTVYVMAIRVQCLFSFSVHFSLCFRLMKKLLKG